ncbi:efflux RND transporter periplasmic adaptor subunit [candidate division KSB1 bacterium]|nr:efflux RND transporter periplasmic adaptor subunit [candidate division KSB1 bacterium]
MSRLFIHSVIMISLAAFIISCSQSGSSSQEQVPAIPVEVKAVELGNVIQSLNYSGDIEAEFDVKVFSKIPDRIEKLYVDTGDEISKGAPIAKVLAITIEQSVRQAQASLSAAKAQEANLRVEYDRAKRLFAENAMSKQQFDAVETQYEAVTAQVQQVEAALAGARSTLDDATITAPISGIIGKRYYDTGDMAAPTMPVVSIVQMDRVKIHFDATEEDLGKLALNQKTAIRVKSFPNVVFEGKVSKISPILDPVTRMAEIEVLVNNAEHKLKPGMYARVEVTTGIIQNTIVVPRHATIENTTMNRVNGKDEVAKNYYVYVVSGERAEQRLLKVQYVNQVHIAVVSGVSVGEKLVITGQNNLRDSSLVAIMK